MSCCGGQRSSMRSTGGPVGSLGNRPVVRRYSHAFFRYLGNAAMTVQGPATGRLYKFVRNGPTVAVDPRDAASLARLPQLRRMARP